MSKKPTFVQFCGHNLTALYKYDLEGIFEFLDDVVKKPDDFYIRDEEVRKVLPVILEQLKSLTAPSGVHFNDPNDPQLDPKQHIYRKLNGGGTVEAFKSKFLVNLDSKWKHKSPLLGKTKENAGNRVNLSYWSHYDLLGLFLSLMGPAQAGSTKLNFFLPLTTVYGRWCWAIGGTRTGGDEAPAADAGVGQPPHVYQCTWRVREDNSVDYCLGASLAGFDWANPKNGPSRVGIWEKELRLTRFKLLQNFNNIKDEKWTDKNKKEQGWKYETSPRIDESGATGTHFGNCGETYPFLQMFADWSVAIRGEISGLSIQKAFLANDQMKDKYDQATMIEKVTKTDKVTKKEYVDYTFMWPPCKNCQHLLSVARATKQKFECAYGLK